MLRNQIINLSVEPYQRVSTRTIGSVYLAIEALELFKSVSVRVTYMDTTNAYVDSEIITISGSDYSRWGNDDTFLYNYISDKKGFTITSPGSLPVTPVVETPAETPAAETPAETPTKETPVEETPATETPVEETPAKETPVEETPASETPI